MIDRWRRECGIIVVLAVAAIHAGSAVSSAGDWHDRWHYGGFADSTMEDVWADLYHDVYGEGKLDDLYENKHGLWRFGYPVGSGIGCGQCLSYGPPGAARCCLTPLHYRQYRPAVLSATQSRPVGHSWYRTRRTEDTRVIRGASVTPPAPAD